MKPTITKAAITALAVMLATTAPARPQQSSTPTGSQPTATSGSPVDAAAVDKMLAELTQRIAPFHLDDAKDGFQKEFDGQDNPLKASSGVPEISTKTIAKPRPTGGKTSIEIASVKGKLSTIVFKFVEGSGFSAIWNAKPVAILEAPTTPETSNGIGFGKVTLVNGEVATEYDLIGSNSWSMNTHPYKD